MEGGQKREPEKDARIRRKRKRREIKRWKRNLKKKARSERRRVEHKAMSTNDEQ